MQLLFYKERCNPNMFTLLAIVWPLPPVTAPPFFSLSCSKPPGVWLGAHTTVEML